MKTLYQQLKPEIKQELNKQEEKYPSMVKALKIALKDNFIWSHLSIGEVRDIVYFTDYTYASLSSYDWSYGEKFLIADE
jgi:hypothetical protein|tara:strand:+ start:1442 stop:1678 length:237 start_codon:yes stop_codon:yes gene_type:complete